MKLGLLLPSCGDFVTLLVRVGCGVGLCMVLVKAGGLHVLGREPNKFEGFYICWSKCRVWLRSC